MGCCFFHRHRKSSNQLGEPVFSQHGLRHLRLQSLCQFAVKTINVRFISESPELINEPSKIMVILPFFLGVGRDRLVFNLLGVSNIECIFFDDGDGFVFGH